MLAMGITCHSNDVNKFAFVVAWKQKKSACVCFRRFYLDRQIIVWLSMFFFRTFIGCHFGEKKGEWRKCSGISLAFSCIDFVCAKPATEETTTTAGKLLPLIFIIVNFVVLFFVLSFAVSLHRFPFFHSFSSFVICLCLFSSQMQGYLQRT